MRGSACFVMTTWLLAALAPTGTSAQGVAIVIESRTVRADDMRFMVRLDTDREVSQTVNDITYDPRAPIASKINLRPRCEVNPSIDKDGSTFAYRPPGCAPGTCTGVRALVYSLSTLDPIPSGSELYECSIAVDTPPGTYPLTCSDPGAKNPNGEAVEVACVDGEVTVEAGTVVQPGLYNVTQGTSVQIDVTMFSNESPVRISADLLFDPATPVRGDAADRPACAVADAVTTLGTFRFLPDGCVAGVDCTGVHAEVESATETVLASGAVLFSCPIDVPLGTPLDSYALHAINGAGTTASGAPADVVGRDGVIVVFPQVPTQPPEPTPTPLRTSVDIGSASGAPGSRVQIEAVLHTSEVVGGIQNDLHFDPQAPIAAGSDGSPLCAFSSLFAHNSRTAFQPPFCTPGQNCTGIRALVFGDPPAPIADDTVLYTCTIAIASDAAAPATLPLTCSMHLGSDPQGNPLPIACTDGAVEILPPEPTATPIPIAPTDTPQPATPPATGQRGQSGGGGGCQVGETGTGGALWLVCVPFLAMTLRRPRR